MRSTALILGAIVAAAATTGLRAQELPLAPLRGTDQGVWPAYEGWYDAGDGTYIIYFGYNNRNADAAVDVPLGANNFIEPARFDGGQPTHFEPRRDWGVFGIRVPANHPPQSRIYWNLVIDGRTYRIPGHLQPDYKTDALGGGASEAMPPRLTVDGAQGAGPMGVTAPRPLRARVGQGLELTVGVRAQGAAGSGLAAAFGALAGAGAASDDGDADAVSPAGGRGGGAGLGGVDPDVLAAMMGQGGIQVTWFKHQGPGAVTFSSPMGRVAEQEGDATTIATFAAPGDYVVRARAIGGDMATSGHAQCCWSNAFYNISVTP